MKLTYIYHSGFVIEAGSCNIVIDFFKDSETLRKGVVHDVILKSAKKLYVLSTHSHADHFNREILEWKKNNPDITCIFSKDILDAGLATAESAIFLDKLQEYSDDYLKITAFGSTDIGGSFLIECEGKYVFHAGDLNNWHWDEESTPDEINEAESAYLAELNILSQRVRELDVLMFPVDARLGKNYTKGAQQFIQKIKVKMFAPMHFGKDYVSANAFEAYTEGKKCKFFIIKEKGDSVIF